jgi:hypothetical protein
MGMTVIKVKFLSPTNHRGARLQASANGFKTTIPFPHAHNQDLAFYQAVKELVKQHALDWNIKDMRYGDDEQGIYYFTFNSSTIQE